MTCIQKIYNFDYLVFAKFEIESNTGSSSKMYYTNIRIWELFSILQNKYLKIFNQKFTNQYLNGQ